MFITSFHHLNIKYAFIEPGVHFIYFTFISAFCILWCLLYFKWYMFWLCKENLQICSLEHIVLLILCVARNKLLRCKSSNCTTVLRVHPNVVLPVISPFAFAFWLRTISIQGKEELCLCRHSSEKKHKATYSTTT